MRGGLCHGASSRPTDRLRRCARRDGSGAQTPSRYPRRNRARDRRAAAPAARTRGRSQKDNPALLGSRPVQREVEAARRILLLVRLRLYDVRDARNAGNVSVLPRRQLLGSHRRKAIFALGESEAGRDRRRSRYRCWRAVRGHKITQIATDPVNHTHGAQHSTSAPSRLRRTRSDVFSSNAPIEVPRFQAVSTTLQWHPSCRCARHETSLLDVVHRIARRTWPCRARPARLLRNLDDGFVAQRDRGTGPRPSVRANGGHPADAPSPH